MVDYCKFNIFEERLIMFYEFDNIMKLLDSLIGRDGEAVKKKHCNFRPLTATFEHRHENKSCSACPEDQLELF